MKKRLLSAVLALAMALTLLPMSVFAAAADGATEGSPVSGKSTVTYVGRNDFSKKDKNGDPVAEGWAWEWKNTADNNKVVWASSTNLGGIVVGTNASGVWYDSIESYKNDNGTLKGFSFTLLGDVTDFKDTYLASNSVSGSLQVNLFGYDLTFARDVLDRYTQVTITDTYATQYGGNAGVVSGISRNVGTYHAVNSRTTLSASGLTLSITGAEVDGINLVGRGNNVTLTGTNVTGAIILNGTTTVTNANGTSATTYPGQTLTIKSQAAQPNYGMAAIRPATDTITVTGDSSRVELTDVSATGKAVGVTSTGGTVKLDGATTVGKLTVGAGANATTTQAPAAVTIDATVAGFERTDDAGSKSTAPGKVDVTINGNVTAALESSNGAVTVDAGTTTGITLGKGSLTIKGTSPATVGDVTLSTTGATSLSVSGTGHRVGDITATNGKNLTISANGWPADRNNVFGELTLTGYTGGGIKGGTFKTPADSEAEAAWFSGLQFMRKFTSGGDTYYAYYGPKELATAIANAGTDAKNGAGTPAAGSTPIEADAIVLTVMGSTPDKFVGFYNSAIDATSGPQNAIALLGYGKTTAIYLPDKINGVPVTSWTNTVEAKTYPINEQQSLISTVPSGTIKLVLQGTGAAVSKLTNAAVSGSNPNVTVTMNGNQVVLSGAVGQSVYEDIMVKFTTDLIGSDGAPVTFEVPVAFNTEDKTATFGTLGITDIPAGVTVNNNNVVVGSNTYTLSVSGLAKPASDLKVAGITTGYTTEGKGIEVTVNCSMTPVEKQALIDAIAGAGAEFDWTTSPAARQAVNSAWATITNNKQLETWINTVKRNAWNIRNSGVTPTADQLDTTGFDTVVLVPYLQVTVTQYNKNGTMTANLVPSYRVEVRNPSVSNTDPYYQIFKNRANGTADGNYIIQTGRALPAMNSNLTGSANTDVGVTVKFHDLPSTFDTANMHQDGAYVYPIDTDTYTLTHAGKTGLGTVILNSTPHSVELVRKVGALDQNGQAVTDPAGGGATSVVWGYYDSLQAAVDDTLPQLLDKMDTINVKSNYGGNGSISVTGDVRTFNVNTEGNTTIASNANSDLVSVTGTGHEYVVQLLKANVTSASIVVISDPNNNGTAAITSNNVNAKPGEKVTVTLTPKQGYQGTITAKTNSGAAVAVTNNGNNTFTFTVPSGATRVDVTPVFTPISALPFTDVATTANYYNAVKYCYEKNLIQGTTNTTFAPNSTITRAQIVTILWRQAGAPRQTPAGIYKDMPGNSDYYNAVIWATNNNIATGYEDGRFYPDRAINRQELATFLYRYQVNFKKGTTAGSVGNLNSYTDASQVGTWANAAMRWAVGNGIVTSVSSGRLTPKDNAPRWQAATAMYMYCSGVLGIV